eukprot:4566111-Pyramimonas_sp.AAC.1
MSLVASLLRGRPRYARRRPTRSNRVGADVVDPSPDRPPELCVELVGLHGPLPPHAPSIKHHVAIGDDVNATPHQTQSHAESAQLAGRG